LGVIASDTPYGLSLHPQVSIAITALNRTGAASLLTNETVATIFAPDDA
jgi:hypothetical protein